MLDEDPEWINSVVTDIHKKTRKQVWPCIQANSAFGEKVSENDFILAVKNAKLFPATGMNVYSWSGLKGNSRFREVYRDKE